MTGCNVWKNKHWIQIRENDDGMWRRGMAVDAAFTAKYNGIPYILGAIKQPKSTDI